MSDQQSLDLSSTQQLWGALLPYDVPDRYMLGLLLFRHGRETVHYAIEQTATKRSKLNGQMDAETATRLFSAICCSLTKAQKHLAATK